MSLMELEVYKAFRSVGVDHEVAEKAAVALYDAHRSGKSFSRKSRSSDINRVFVEIRKTWVLNIWLLGVMTGLSIAILMDLFLRR